MLGNSDTSGQSGSPQGGTSDDVQGLFDADPDNDASVTEYAPGGKTLEGHASDPLALALITDSSTYQWDVVVLQEQSLRPGLAMKFGGSELDDLDAGGPVLIDLIRTHQPQARVVLFNTWARHPDEPDLVAYFDNDPLQMAGFTNQGYDRIRENLPDWDHSDVTTIARAGDAWTEWYAGYGYGGPAPLHAADGSHQNGLGSYLAAAVVYETISGKSSVGNCFAGSYQGGVGGGLGGESLLRLLQEQATATTGVPAPRGLAPGDVVVIGVHGDGTSTSAAGAGDAFSWVPLKPLAPGEVLYFSDVGYYWFEQTNCGFGATQGSFQEGLLRFTAPAGGVAAGAVQTVDPMSVPGAEYSLAPGNAYTPELSQDWINLSTGGDQLVVFQDDEVATTAGFRALFAVTTATTDWSAAADPTPGDPTDGGTGSESNLYPGLAEGGSAIAAGAGPGSADEFDNARYVGVTTGTAAELALAIADPSNWERTDADQSGAGGGPGSGVWTTNGVAQFTVIGAPATGYCFGDGSGTPCPCANAGAAGAGCANSTGAGGVLLASGSDSVSSDDLAFDASQLLPGQPALLFAGQEAPNGGAGLAFGDGLRCAGANVVRLGVAIPDVSGAAGWGPGLAAGAGFGAGDTRRFQSWYRDPTGGPCGSGFNLTGALEVTFVP